MNKDKFLVKALKSKDNTKLSADFNTRLMNQIYKVVAAKKRQSMILTFSLITVVSLGLVSLAVYLLKDYLSFSSLLYTQSFLFTSQSKTIFGFSVYIASLILVLIFIDNYFRNLREKRLNKSR